MSAPRPVASGVLAKTPLPNLVVYILDRELSGTLVLETTEGSKSAVTFVKGVPAKARTGEPVIFLGRLLLEQGLIDEATEARTLGQVAQEQRLHGQLLVESGAITKEQLIKALQEQVTRKLQWMFGLPGTTAYGFYQDVDFLQGYGAENTPIRPLTALWAGVRRHGPDVQVELALDRLGERVLRFHPEAAIKKFGLNASELSVIDVIRAKPQPISSLLATGLLDEVQLKRLIYTLFISRHLDLGEGGGDPIGGEAGPASSRRPEPFRAPPEPSPARKGSALDGLMGDERFDERADKRGEAEAQPASPEALALRAEIAERYAVVDKQNYYEILGVPETAATTQIQAAFFQLAKRFHPDKVSAQTLEAQDQVNKVFSRISEAHRVLSDDEQRKEYSRLMREGGASADEQEKVQAVLRAAQHFQKAEVLYKKRDLAGAVEWARKAAQDDPEQADYLAFQAWVASHLPERQDTNNFGDLVTILDRAVAMEPENQRCRWYRGQLHKRAGDMRKAIKDFRWVLDKNPRHVDAQREVRLYEMRRQTGHSPTEQHGKTPPKPTNPPGKGMSADVGQIWGKLFKRDKDK